MELGNALAWGGRKLYRALRNGVAEPVWPSGKALGW